MKPKLLLGLALVLSGGWCGAETYTNLNSEILLKAILTNVWDYSRPFSSVASVTFLDGTSMTLNVGVCSQDGNVRLYVDRGETVGLSLPPALAAKVVAERKREGENRYILLFRGDKSMRYQIFPDKRGYHTNAFVSLMPFMAWTNPVTIQQVSAEEELVNGHPCQKIDWQMNVNGESEVFASVWRARDLKDFPMRFKIKNAVEITFTQPKFEKLDPALFEIPADYQSLDTVEALYGQTSNVRASPTKADLNARILKSHQELAEKGDAYGELRMGLHYRDGDGVPRDLGKAREWLQKAADQGDAEAAAALAKLPKPKM